MSEKPAAVEVAAMKNLLRTCATLRAFVMFLYFFHRRRRRLLFNVFGSFVVDVFVVKLDYATLFFCCVLCAVVCSWKSLREFWVSGCVGGVWATLKVDKQFFLFILNEAREKPKLRQQPKLAKQISHKRKK